TDALACTDNIQVQLNDPASINVSVNINNHVLCYGENNASAIANVSGGTMPYTYTWNYDNTHQAYNNNLPAGTWTVSVEDANHCQAFEQFTITQPQAMNIAFSNVQNISCNGIADGAAIAVVTGGTPSYQYLWSSPSGSTQATAANLPAGTYVVSVTDANSCTAQNQIQITEPEILSISTSSQPVICGISLGSASAQATGGIQPYSYSWTGGASGQNINNLTSGTYTVVVTDGNSCTQTSMIVVGIQGSGVVHITQTQPILCNGDSNATLTAEMINGIAPIAYSWSNSSTGANIQNLGAGIYTVTATDAWGCSGMQSQQVVEPTPILATLHTMPVTCYGGSNGSIIANVSGGNSPYSYQWSNGENTESINNLTAGNYDLSITDAHNCFYLGNTLVEQPDSPVGVQMELTNISCYGESDGSININAFGGTPPYSYHWETDGFETNSQNIENLYEGAYSLIITDANNCIFDTLAMLVQPAPLTATWYSEGPSCYGNNDGYIKVNAIGGTHPYQLFWAEGISPDEYITGLLEGEYIVTVVDDRECKATIGPIVLMDFPEDCIKIPNAFTPNDDGVNDTWIIENIEMFPKSYIQVFNRWGQALYKARGSEIPWDGTYNGRQVPTGPYIYIVELFNGNKPYTGTVTIVR
ncbi:MAG: T9SS type B sorting domain-containing protein, partial [Bacteroidales bacterium]|nr:T9SS type B sorting domain-containing protein [Bacteroidales bacterium]